MRALVWTIEIAIDMTQIVFNQPGNWTRLRQFTRLQAKIEFVSGERRFPTRP